MTKLISIVTVVAVALVPGSAVRAKDGNASPDTAATGIARGSVVMKPACPGPAQIGRPECAARPIQTIVRVFAVSPSGGATEQASALITVATDAHGQFRIALPPGSYRLVPAVAEGIARAKPADIAVTAGSTTNVELLIDSGMR